MKVRELQEHLGKFDPEMDVICYCEDERFLVEKRGFILLDVLAVNSAEAKRFRFDDRTPYLNFGRGSASVAMAILEVTSDF